MSGIGSSSSFTVGLLLALHGLMGKMATKRELAEQAIEIEQRRIRENVGSQDQYAAAFGGFNRIDFGPEKTIHLTPLTLQEERLTALQNNLLFCFSGLARYSTEIQAEHVQNIPLRHRELGEMKTLVNEAQTVLSDPGADLDAFGSLLDAAWKIKRGFSSKVSTDALDEIYDRAVRAGALGGKVCGAGGGGFMVFYVPRQKRAAVEQSLHKTMIVPIRFEQLGTHVIFYTHENRESGKDIIG
jgi:D-glycero-alpha-D-manno-heptose-7-phosphate kinase